MTSADVKVLILLTFAGGGIHRATGGDYYVGSAGASDLNPGTAGQPLATIQKATDVAVAGDFADLPAGTYRETLAPANSGTTGHPIGFQADGNARVTVSGADLADGGWTFLPWPHLPEDPRPAGDGLPRTDYRQRQAAGQSGVCRRRDDDRSPLAERGQLRRFAQPD